MPSTQDIRRRIRSVKNIQQITKAMKMVAAARLRRAQEKAAASKPYADKIREVLLNVSVHAKDVKHPLLEKRETRKIGYLLINADKGLAGAYTSNLVRAVVPQLDTTKPLGIMAVGRKMRDYFRRRNYNIDAEFIGFSERPTYEHAMNLASHVAQTFAEGQYDEIYMAYTEFHSAIRQTPVMVKLLPLDQPENNEKPGNNYIFEPNADEVLSELLPKYLESTIYGALQQSAASELGARMAAMGSATDNAKELISQLTLTLNKVRQAYITREISEIVGGAEALQ